MASSNIKGKKETLLVAFQLYPLIHRQHTKAWSDVWEYRTSKSLLLPHAEPYKNWWWSEPDQKAALRSQLQTSEFNQIPWKVKVYFNTNKISFQRPKAPGKDHWLHSPACTQPWHHCRLRKLTFLFFWSQSATKARKLLLLPTILSTGIKTPKWTCRPLSQKLVLTSWNREDKEELCTSSGSWWGQKHSSWACCTGVTQPN